MRRVWPRGLGGVSPCAVRARGAAPRLTRRATRSACPTKRTDRLRDPRARRPGVALPVDLAAAPMAPGPLTRAGGRRTFGGLHDGHCERRRGAVERAPVSTTGAATIGRLRPNQAAICGRRPLTGAGAVPGRASAVRAAVPPRLASGYELAVPGRAGACQAGPACAGPITA